MVFEEFRPERPLSRLAERTRTGRGQMCLACRELMDPEGPAVLLRFWTWAQDVWVRLHPACFHGSAWETDTWAHFQARTYDPALWSGWCELDLGTDAARALFETTGTELLLERLAEDGAHDPVDTAFVLAAVDRAVLCGQLPELLAAELPGPARYLLALHDDPALQALADLRDPELVAATLARWPLDHERCAPLRGHRRLEGPTGTALRRRFASSRSGNVP